MNKKNIREKTPKILFLDIEISPALGYVWGKWETNVIEFKDTWYILSYAYKWYGDKTPPKAVSLPDFKGYSKNKSSDLNLCKSLHKLLEEADIVVAHNGDAFDVKKINARFLINKLLPPKPYATVDTLKILRRKFGFMSNKLNDIGIDLGVGKKLPNSGFATWKGAMEGDKKSWKTMTDYNIQDIILLENIYEKVRGWTTGSSMHPNINIITCENGCPTCGSYALQSRGFIRTISQIKQRFQCTDCGKWSSSKYDKNHTKTEVRAI